MSKQRLRVFLLCLIALPVISCGDANLNELREYAQKTKSRPGRGIEPLPAIQTVEPYEYSAHLEEKRSPFEPPALQVSRNAIPLDFSENPEMQRPKELLELVPIDSLQMVGTLFQNGEDWALIQDKEGLLHRLQVGDHLGQNFGRVEKIYEDYIEIVELVDNGRGGWVERPVTMGADN